MAEIDKALPNISEQPEQTNEDLAVEMEQQLLDQADPNRQVMQKSWRMKMVRLTLILIQVN
jgi:hypothetical protein